MFLLYFVPIVKIMHESEKFGFSSKKIK
jgi:hypothetical protein